MVGISDQSCSLAGMGSANLGWSCRQDRRAQNFSCSERLFCPGQDSHEPVQLTASQLSVTQASSRHSGPVGDKCRPSCERAFSSSFTTCALMSVSCCCRKAQALPWGGSTLTCPFGGSASLALRARLPTVWSFSAFSLGRERMKGQEEGGLRPRKRLAARARPSTRWTQLASCQQEGCAPQVAVPGCSGPPALTGREALRERPEDGRPWRGAANGREESRSTPVSEDSSVRLTADFLHSSQGHDQTAFRRGAQICERRRSSEMSVTEETSSHLGLEHSDSSGDGVGLWASLPHLQIG